MWIYKGKEVTEIEEGAIGFIYKISLLEDSTFQGWHPTKFYIGKKQLYTNRKTKITQKEKIETTNNRKKFKIVTKESDWQTYNSSCIELKNLIKELGEDRFQKEIIEWCFNKRGLNYKEVWWQFFENVLEKDTFNGNIANRWYKPKNI